MQENIIKLQFNIKNEEVKNKIYKVYQSFIPMQDLFETLLLQADLNYYEKLLKRV